MAKTKQMSVPSDAFFAFAQLVGENNVRATVSAMDEDDGAVIVSI